MAKAQVPFDEDGNMMVSIGFWVHRAIAEGTFKGTLRDNVPFEDTLYYQGYRKNGGSALFEFKRRSDECLVHFHAAEIDHIILRMNNGILQGRFGFTHRGGKWTLKMLEN